LPTFRYSSPEDLEQTLFSERAKRFAVIDIESTGKKAATAFPLEIGAVVVDPHDPLSHMRPEGRFSALIRPPIEEIFRPGTDIERLRSMGALSDVTHPEFLKSVSEDVAGAFSIHGITPAELFEKGRPIEEVAPEFQSWLRKTGVSSATGYNLKYDKAVLERFGMDIPWVEPAKGGDIMVRAWERLGLKKGEASAENVSRLLGILGPKEKEIHRGLADAELEARILSSLDDPEIVDQAMEKLRLIRGERKGLSRLGQKASQRAFVPLKKGIRSLFTADNLSDLAKKNPLLAGATGIAGLYAFGSITKPLSLIPGSDDAYNTLPGLNEEGMASQLRKINTDFGSGYQGLKVMGQSIAPEIQEFREAWFGDFSDQSRMDQLKAEMAASSEEYGKFEPPELQQYGGRLQKVDLSDFDVRWDDADTLILRRTGLANLFFGKRKDIAIRLAGIDTPEVVHPDDPTAWFRFRQEQPYGSEATRIAETLASGKKLEAVIDPTATTYGRHIGLIYAEGEARSINEQLIAAGAAAHLPFGEAGSDIYNRKAFSEVEQQAISERKGMWQEPFFQTYLDVTKGVGGRITFTTFTDLSRLSRNYKLAAAQQAMWSAQETGEDQRAFGIGRSLRSSYGRFFGTPNTSSKDDDHLQVEALGHGGMGSAMRKDSTDFGSGYRGLIARVLKNIPGASGVAGRVKALSAATGENLGALFAKSPYRHQVIVDLEQVAKSATAFKVSYKEYLQGTIAHERYHQRVVQHGLREDITALDPTGIVPKEFAKWASVRGYIKQEALGSASLTEEYFAWAHTASKFKKSSEFTKMFEPAWERLGIKARSQRIFKSGKLAHSKALNEAVQRQSVRVYSDPVKKLTMATAQKESMALSATNSQFGGQLHTRYTNKSGKG